MSFGTRKSLAQAALLLAMFLGACTAPTPVTPQAAGTGAVTTFNNILYSFEYPVGWVPQTPEVYNPQVVHNVTLSYAPYSRFRFTVVSQPMEMPPGFVVSLAELCGLQDEIRAKYPRGVFEKKDTTIDGALACYGIFKELDTEIHVMSTLVDGNYFRILYQFSYKALLDDTKTRVTADMERLLKSWKWKHPAATPAATPAPSASPEAEEVSKDDFQDYFPVFEGGKWTYQVLKNGVNKGSMTATMTKYEARPGQSDLMTVERKWVLSEPIAGKPATETVTYEKSTEGLHIVPDEGKSIRILQMPVMDGERYWLSGVSFFTMEGYETLATPLGPIYGALKVHQKRGDKSTMDRWFTPELGLMQEIETDAEGGTVTVTLADFSQP